MDWIQDWRRDVVDDASNKDKCALDAANVCKKVKQIVDGSTWLYNIISDSILDDHLCVFVLRVECRLDGHSRSREG